MKKTVIRYSGSQATIVCLALGVALHFTALPGLSKGKPGGGGDPPPPTPAPVEYQLTWIPGINDGYISVYDSNAAGIAVGIYADETGTRKPFCTTADGVITPLDNRWALPPGYEAEGWRVGGQFGEIQINEANLVCGSLVNDLTSEHQLFLANLSDPDSLEPVGSVLGNHPSHVHMNEHGDVAFRVTDGITTEHVETLHLYVRSLDKMFGWEQDLRGYIPTGINDNLQVSLVYQEFIWVTPTVIYNHGSGLLTFDVATEEAVIDDLGTAWTIDEPITLPFGGINNDGTVFGCFETKAPRYRIRGNRLVSRSSDATAGFISAGAETWTELDASLPTGSTLATPYSIDMAACALGVNEFGQVVGGYHKVSARYGCEDLWLLDPEHGLFDVNDLVVGDLAEVEAFRAANNIGLVHITEIDPETGYGIISGSAGAGFILTPRLIK
ncbi:MAG: hypothetical protein R3F19_14205 [Verrucomicrobiales bacterium]